MSFFLVLFSDAGVSDSNQFYLLFVLKIVTFFIIPWVTFS